jgi:hypothetical protein
MLCTTPRSRRRRGVAAAQRKPTLPQARHRQPRAPADSPGGPRSPPPPSGSSCRHQKDLDQHDPLLSREPSAIAASRPPAIAASTPRCSLRHALEERRQPLRLTDAADDNRRSHGARPTVASPRRTTRRTVSTRTRDRRRYRSGRRRSSGRDVRAASSGALTGSSSKRSTGAVRSSKQQSAARLSAAASDRGLRHAPTRGAAAPLADRQ